MEFGASLIFSLSGEGTCIFLEPENYLTNYGAAGTAERFTGPGYFIGPTGDDGRPDVVGCWWGYNTDTEGTRIQTDDAAFRYQTETHFQVFGTGVGHMEFHMPIFQDVMGDFHRPLSIYTGIDTTDLHMDMEIRHLDIYYPNEGLPFFTLQGNGGTIIYMGRSSVLEDVAIQFDNASGNSADIRLYGDQPLFHINASGAVLGWQSGYIFTLQGATINANSTNMFDGSGLAIVQDNADNDGTHYSGLYIYKYQGSQHLNIAMIDNLYGGIGYDFGVDGRTGMYFHYNGNMGIDVPEPLANLDIKAGNATYGPLKLHGGPLVTELVTGLVEYDATNLYFTRDAAREVIVTVTPAAEAPPTSCTPVFTHYYGGNTNALGDPDAWVDFVVGAIVYEFPLFKKSSI